MPTNNGNGGLWGKIRRFFGSEPEQDENPYNLPVFVPEVKVERPSSSPIPAQSTGDIDAVFLRQQMMNHLDPAELETLCRQLEIDYAGLSGGKGRKVMQVMVECERRRLIPDVFEFCRRTHPDVSWQLEEDERG